MPTATVDFLATVPLFRALDRDETARFAQFARERPCARGSVIVLEDEPGDAFFVVREGRVKVVLIAPDGREVILGILGVGDHFGELSLIDGQPRSAHVIAMEDAQLLVMRHEDFRRRLEANPAVAWALLVELSRRLRRADDKIGALVLLDVPGRIAHLLLEASDASGGPLLDQPLTHQTIAHLIGASRETVSRSLREFVAAGWIATEGRRMRLLDRSALERRAHQRT